MSDRNIIEEIEKLNESWMEDFTRGDAKAVAEHYTEDAVSFPPGSRPVVGKQAIIDYWREAMVSGAGSLNIQSKEVGRADDTIVEIGETELQNPVGDILDLYNYMVIWKKSGDTWLIYREIWNSVLK